MRYSLEPEVHQRNYRFGLSKLTLVFGDLTKARADVLVSSDDFLLTMGGGVSAALRRAAGEAVIIDAAKKIPARLGDVVVTTAGALSAKHIFHCITIGAIGDDLPSEEVISRTINGCLGLMDVLRLDSIAFPAIGAGVAGFRYDEVAARMAEVISQNLKIRQRPIDVFLYLFDRFKRLSSPMHFIRFYEEFAARVRDLPPSDPVQAARKSAGLELKATTPPKTLRQEHAQELAKLAQERDQIEARLAEFEASLPKAETQNLQTRLNEIHLLRLRTLAEMRRPGEGAEILVFISYSSKDAKYREAFQAHLQSLERMKLITTWHDRKIAAGTEWQGQIDENLEKATVILLLISPNFIASDYCVDLELKRAMARHEEKTALVIPVLVVDCVWDGMPFAKLDVLPQDGKPVARWKNRAEAWTKVTQGIKSSLLGFQANRRSEPA